MSKHAAPCGHGRQAPSPAKKTWILICSIAVSVLLAAALLVTFALREKRTVEAAALRAASAEPAVTATAAASASASPSASASASPSPSATAEPQAESFLISFAGDCTMGDEPEDYGSSGGWIATVGSDYTYPFKGVYELFSQDEFTFVNLEGVLTLEGSQSDKTFVFHASEDYVQCLTEGSVEMVTLANNHTEDFGDVGLSRTEEVLDAAGVLHVGNTESTVVTTPNGLKLGFYAASWPGEYGLAEAIADLKSQSDIVICAFHWGDEGEYHPDGDQEYIAHLAIDSGADIVYGSHPHVLQPVEEYGDGVIYYSMSNFTFGGNGNPRDKDTAVIQQEIIREPDGTVHLGETILLPCRISSVDDDNDYQPTLLKEGTEEYTRAMSKLNGTFDGPDLVVDYSFLDAPAATEAPAAAEEETAAEAPEEEVPVIEETPVEEAPVEEAPAEASGGEG